MYVVICGEEGWWESSRDKAEEVAKMSKSGMAASDKGLQNDREIRLLILC